MILINTSCQQFLANGCHKLDWAKELLLALVEPRVYVELEALVPKAIARVHGSAWGEDRGAQAAEEAGRDRGAARLESMPPRARK